MTILDSFINDMTDRLYEFGYPFVTWEIDLQHIELSVKDNKGDLVKEVWQRRMIVQDYSSSMVDYLSWSVHTKFQDKMFYEQKYYSRW